MPCQTVQNTAVWVGVTVRVANPLEQLAWRRRSHKYNNTKEKLGRGYHVPAVNPVRSTRRERQSKRLSQRAADHRNTCSTRSSGKRGTGHHPCRLSEEESATGAAARRRRCSTQSCGKRGTGHHPHRLSGNDTTTTPLLTTDAAPRGPAAAGAPARDTIVLVPL